MRSIITYLLSFGLAVTLGGFAHRLIQRVEESVTNEVHEQSNPDQGYGLPAPNQLDLIQKICREDDRVKREAMLSHFSPEGFPALLAALRANPQLTLKINGLIQIWARWNAEDLLAHAKLGELSGQEIWVASFAFLPAPDATLTWLESLPAEEQWAAAKALGYIDIPPERKMVPALPILEALDSHEFFQNHPARWQIASACIKLLVNQDPRAAMTYADEHPIFFHEVADAMVERNPVEALGLIKRSNIDESWESVLQEMTQKHPELLKECLAMAEDKTRIYQALAKAQKQAALPVIIDWIETLTIEKREGALETFSSGDTDEIAVALAMAFPEIESKYVEQVVERYADRNPRGLLQDYLAGKFPPALAEETLPYIVASLRMVDRQGAMDFVRAQPPSELMGGILLEETRIFQEGDAQSIQERALAITQPVLRLGALKRASRSIDKTLTEEDWLARIPDAASREEMVRYFQEKDAQR